MRPILSHLASSALLAFGQAAARGPMVAGATLTDARRSDRAPSDQVPIYVASSTSWTPLRLVIFAVCWELRVLSRSARLRSSRARTGSFTIVFAAAVNLAEALVVPPRSSSPLWLTSADSPLPRSVCPRVLVHLGPAGLSGGATPIRRAASLSVRRLLAGPSSATGPRSCSCSASSSGSPAFVAAPAFPECGTTSASPSVMTVARSAADLGGCCIPPPRAGIPRLPALYLTGDAMTAI